MIKIADMRFQKIKANGGEITVTGTITSGMIAEAGGVHPVIMELASLMSDETLKLSPVVEHTSGAPETLGMLKDGVDRLIRLAQAVIGIGSDKPETNTNDEETPLFNSGGAQEGESKDPESRGVEDE